MKEEKKFTKEEVIKSIRREVCFPGSFRYSLEDMPDDLKRDIDVIVAFVKDNYLNTEYIPEDLQEKTEVIVAIVKKNARALDYAPKKFKEVKELALEMVKANWKAVNYLSDDLRRDKDVFLIAVDGRKDRLEAVMNWMSSDRDSGIIGSFRAGEIDLGETINKLDLSNPLLYEVTVIASKEKIKKAFFEICEEEGIKDDKLPKEIEEAFMKKVDETVLLLEEERKKYEEGLNIKSAIDKIGKIKI